MPPSSPRSCVGRRNESTTKWSVHPADLYWTLLILTTISACLREMKQVPPFLFYGWGIDAGELDRDLCVVWLPLSSGSCRIAEEGARIGPCFARQCWVVVTFFSCYPCLVCTRFSHHSKCSKGVINVLTVLPAYMEQIHPVCWTKWCFIGKYKRSLMKKKKRCGNLSYFHIIDMKISERGKWWWT